MLLSLITMNTAKYRKISLLYSLFLRRHYINILCGVVRMQSRRYPFCGSHKNGRDLIGKRQEIGKVLGQAVHPQFRLWGNVFFGGMLGGNLVYIRSYIRSHDLWWLLGRKPRCRNASVSTKTLLDQYKYIYIIYIYHRSTYEVVQFFLAVFILHFIFLRRLPFKMYDHKIAIR